MPPVPPLWLRQWDGWRVGGRVNGRTKGGGRVAIADGCGRSIGTGGREGLWEKGMEGPGTEGEGRRMGGMD